MLIRNLILYRWVSFDLKKDNGLDNKIVFNKSNNLYLDN